uniref:hypothetical protein n=1 Tax=Staphylococcus epidermidis TaxID=1282 RepID=UPI001C9365EE
LCKIFRRCKAWNALTLCSLGKRASMILQVGWYGRVGVKRFVRSVERLSKLKCWKIIGIVGGICNNFLRGGLVIE